MTPQRLCLGRVAGLAVVILCACATLRAQTDRGVLTGVVVDTTSAAVPGASLTARHLATGAEFHTASTETGAYTLPALPTGEYSIVVELAGFKKFTQSPIQIDVAQTARLDVTLSVGAATESITVSADASMLQETSDYSLSMSGDRMADLPLNFAVGPGAIRSPFGFLELMPGASNAELDVQTASGWGIDIRVNGMPNNSFKALVDGQDGTNPFNPRLNEEHQPSNEAVQAFTLQSSNYAAEFGRAGGGLINFTTKSGTNQWHASTYDYERNEVLGAGLPYSNDGSGHLVRARDRQRDFGFSLGGPLQIPHVYNGRNRTFFFVNYEMFRKIERRYSGLLDAPTDAFRNGDFSAALTGRALTKDNIGRNILEGTIYDYATDRTENGVQARDVFPGNIIPKSRMDPVALAIQNLIPKPLVAGTIASNNYWNYTPTRKIMSIPSVKIDELIGPARLSFYYSHERVDKDNGPDGWPYPVSVQRYQQISSNTARLNYDHTLSPTLFNHMGAGLFWYRNPDQGIGKDFDTSSLGLPGVLNTGFPIINLNNINPTSNVKFGIASNITYVAKPTAVESLSWVLGNHTYKFGGEWSLESTSRYSFLGGVGTYTFNAAQTSYTTSPGLNGGYIGNGYASFLLGAANSGVMGPLGGVGYRRMAWGFFAQDTWKAARRLTFDYGLRYDLQPLQHELNYRTASFDPELANPTVGGIKGGIRFEGEGPGRCNCRFAPTYPYALGPRLGVAWQIRPKTILRAGWGVSYSRIAQLTANPAYSAGFGFNTLNFGAPATGRAAFFLKNGIPYKLSDLFADQQAPGLRPINATAAPTTLDVPNLDRNAGRPPRVVQWNITLQRELMRDLVAQAAYVGNRAVWLTNDAMIDYNANSPERLATQGINMNSATDRSLLTSQIGSAAVVARGFKLPYAGFPATSTLAQALRPFPQFGTISSLWAPLGNSYYDSLQATLSKRASHGIDATVSFTWSKNLTNTTNDAGASIYINDPFNRDNAKSFSPYDQPRVLAFGFGWQLPTFHLDRHSRFARNALRGWSLRGVFRYASGLPIQAPLSQTNMNSLVFRTTLAVRVKDEPLYLQDLNCRCFDPAKTLVFNPAAWVDPPAGQYGPTSPYYNDYRYQRRPKESASLAKTLRVRERYRIDFRAEFFNIFNRPITPSPTGTNAKITTLRNPDTGEITQGFGRIDTNNVQAGSPRSGQLVLRVSF